MLNFFVNIYVSKVAEADSFFPPDICIDWSNVNVPQWFRRSKNLSSCNEKIQSKTISNDQELIQSDPTSCPQNQKGNNKIHTLTAVYERHSQ